MPGWWCSWCLGGGVIGVWVLVRGGGVGGGCRWWGGWCAGVVGVGGGVVDAGGGV